MRKSRRRDRLRKPRRVFGHSLGLSSAPRRADCSFSMALMYWPVKCVPPWRRPAFNIECGTTGTDPAQDNNGRSFVMVMEPIVELFYFPFGPAQTQTLTLASQVKLQSASQTSTPPPATPTPLHSSGTKPLGPSTSSPFIFSNHSDAD